MGYKELIKLSDEDKMIASLTRSLKGMVTKSVDNVNKSQTKTTITLGNVSFDVDTTEFDKVIKQLEKKKDKIEETKNKLLEAAKANKGMYGSSARGKLDDDTQERINEKVSKKKGTKEEISTYRKQLEREAKLINAKETYLQTIKKINLEEADMKGVEDKYNALIKLKNILIELEELSAKTGSNFKKTGDIKKFDLEKQILDMNENMSSIMEKAINNAIAGENTKKENFIEEQKNKLYDSVLNTKRPAASAASQLKAKEKELEQHINQRQQMIEKIEQDMIKSMQEYVRAFDKTNDISNEEKHYKFMEEYESKRGEFYNRYLDFMSVGGESQKMFDSLNKYLENNPKIGKKYNQNTSDGEDDFITSMKSELKELNSIQNIKKEMQEMEMVIDPSKLLKQIETMDELIAKTREEKKATENFLQTLDIATSGDELAVVLQTRIELLEKDIKRKEDLITELQNTLNSSTVVNSDDNSKIQQQLTEATQEAKELNIDLAQTKLLLNDISEGKTSETNGVGISPNIDNPQAFVDEITQQLKGHSVKVDVELNKEGIETEITKITDLIPDKKEIEVSIKQNDLYNSLKHWREVNSSSSEMGTLPEQVIAANTKTGYSTSPNVKGTIAGTPMNLINEVVDGATEAINAVFHSHPEETTSSFSYDDIERAAELLSRNIIEQYTVSLNDISKLDLSAFNKDEVFSIANRLKELTTVDGASDNLTISIDEEKALMRAFKKDLDTEINKLFSSIFSSLDTTFVNGSSPVDLSELNNKLLAQYKKAEIKVDGDSDNVLDAITKLYNKVIKSFDLEDTSIFDKTFTDSLMGTIDRIMQEFQEDMLKQAISEVTPHINPDDVYQKLSFSDFKNKLELDVSSRDVELNPVLSKEFSADSFVNEITSKLLGKEVEVDVVPSVDSNDFINRLSSYSEKFEDLVKNQPIIQTPEKATQENLEGNKQYDASEEISGMNKLAEGVSKVTTAVDEKTEAFRKEEQVVTGTVQKEISELERLSSQLFSIQGDIEKISTAITSLPKIDFDVDLSKLNIENIDNASIASFNAFREQLAGLEAQLNVSNLSSKLSEVSNAFETLSKLNLENLNTKNLRLTPITNLIKKSEDIDKLVDTLDALGECLTRLKNDGSFDKDYFAGLKFTPKNVNNMADMAVALETVGIALQKFDQEAKDALSSINELVKNAEGLKNLNAIISSPKKTKKVKEAIENEDKPKGPTTAQTNKANTIDDNISNGTYEKELKQVEQRYAKLQNTVDITQGKANELSEAFKDLKEADTVESKIQAFDNFKNALASAKNELTGLEKERSTKSFTDEVNTQLKSIQEQYGNSSYLKNSLISLEAEIERISTSAKEGSADLTNLGKQAKTAFANFQKGVLPSGDFKGTFSNLEEAIEQAKKTVDSYSKVKSELKAPLQVNDNGIAKMTAQVIDFNGQLKNLTFVYNDTTKSMVQQTTNVRTELLGIPGAIDAVKNKLKDMAVYWTATLFDPHDILYSFRQVAEVVIDLNTQMTELAKVSGLSIDRLEKRFSKWANTAKDLGATVSDTISATADWSRLGYSIDEAEKLAEVAILYKNVGDGIDIEAANESLVSTMQGFQLEANQAESVIDSFNEVSNNFAISSAGIGEALQRSASSFYAANTDLNSAIALITATNSVVQDPTRVGNMWKTVSMRIRGATTELEQAGLETEGMAESTSQLRDLIKSMTGFDIMLDDKTYKDMKDIIIGIGEAYKELDDIDQASLLEKLAGKTQGNALSAALENYELIEDAYETAEGSAGSARKEQEAWEKSLEASIQKFKASAETLAHTFVDTGVLDFFITIGKTGVDALDAIINKFGSLATIAGTLGAALSFKNIGKVYKCIPFNDVLNMPLMPKITM